MSNIDLDALEQATLNATPGPWVTNTFGSQVLTGDSWNTVCIMRDYAATSAQWEDGRKSASLPANAEFIASFNPEAALELIRRLRESEKDAGRYNWIKQQSCVQDAIDFECNGNSETLDDIDNTIDEAMSKEANK